VVKVHEDYLAAGSAAVITNTLTMNRVFIESHRLEIDVGKVNRAGARLAREAVNGKGGQAFVLGNLSSRGRTRLPIVAEPNAGKPRLVDGQTVFDMDPPTFAYGMARCAEAGASILGGCCGTSPEHIGALSDVLRGEGRLTAPVAPRKPF
jgi:methionine synthase I (cobalamin-dependent)